MTRPDAALLALCLLAGACSPDPRIEQTQMPDTLPPSGAVLPEAAPAANSADATARDLRDHLNRLRATPPPVAAPLEEHGRRTQELLGRAEADLRGMLEQASARPGGGAGGLGMSPEAHSLALEEIGIARAEARELVGAAPEELRARLPGHLDRLERIAATLESAAAHLRRP
jgi:hypothetical protein